MTNVVFYGTIRHKPLLEVVVGDLSHLDLSDISLPGYAARRIAGEDYPVLVPEDGATETGLLVEGLTDADLSRIVYYDSAFGCALTELALEGTTALFFVSERRNLELADRWSLEIFEKTRAEMTCLAAREVMGYIGRKSPEQVNRMFPMIRARAASRLRAERAPRRGGRFEGHVEIEDRTREYADFFALDDMQLRHERFDGTMTERLGRAVFIAADAALVLPYDPVRDRVLLVEQLRMGPLARDDRQCWQFEPIAGRIDDVETPEHAVRREAREEAGLELGALHRVAEVYPTPGTSTEFYYLYVGIADLPDGAGGHGGLDAEHEDIRSHVIAFDALLELCDTAQAANAPLVMAAYWLARHRERLRGEA
ncbi:NUDIX domain-containing protein [Sulfitobacter sp. D35]|uniref:NUDIX domain-containing protein n=1 Tax=Sulfitobacter sp. D35 TaxID=3083252 RepID=UPI0029700B70|nr:NUDIX domain-containing protein [Sulfitobacter sp. D35]MDW4496408.1 NUDIX domain-containing protein [Sulfitobacter sp. D35]